MNISTIKDCERILESYVPHPSQNHSGAMTTERAEKLAKTVGSPHAKLRIIHVAGTSGKTSTCYFISSLLNLAGSKVGLTVSPHITSIAERVQINGDTLSEEIFVDYFTEFHNLVLQSGIESLSYFEFLMVFALWVFEKEKVEYAVIETGMGGLYDASNICSDASKLAVITDIGLDHMNILGETLPEIAMQKAGIIWPGNLVLCYEQSLDVMRVIEAQVENQSAFLHTISPPGNSSAHDVPLFQQRNWNLAKKVYDFIRLRDNLRELSATELDHSLHVQVPARMEIYKLGDKTIIIDGAHNEQKMTTFFDSFARQFSGVRPTMLLALKEGKELETVAPIIARYSDNVITTEFTKEQDMPRGSMGAEVIAEAIRKSGVRSAVAESSLKQALIKLLSSDNDTLLIIGSFFLAAEVRPLLEKQ